MARRTLMIFNTMAILFGWVLMAHPLYSNSLFFFGFPVGLGIALTGLVLMVATFTVRKKHVRYLLFPHTFILGSLTATALMRHFEGRVNTIWIFTGGILILTLILIIEEAGHGSK